MANENSQIIPYKCMDTIRLEMIKLQKQFKSKSTTLVRKKKPIYKMNVIMMVFVLSFKLK
jgi:hypothetical protein